MTTLTLFDVYSKYLEVASSNAKPMLTSIFVRFLVPSWGGKAPSGSRATPFEIIIAQEYLKKLLISKLVGSVEALEVIFEQNGVTKQNRKSFRSIYKAFFKWAEDNNYFSVQKPEPKTNGKNELFKKSRKHKNSHHGMTHKAPYTLMCRCQDGKLLYENDYINDNLKKEIEEFQKFRHDSNCSPATVSKDTQFIYRLLGWLHRYKDVSLEDLSLKSIISYQKLSVSFKDCLDYNDLNFKKAMTRQTAVELSKENRKTLEEYLDFIGGHPKSKVLVVITCINVAKFIFRNELDDDEYIDESDFPIVRRLNQLTNKLSDKAKKTSPTVPHSHKSLPWESIYPLLDKLKEKCCTDNYDSIGYSKERPRVRTKTAVFNDLQYFLSVAFMTLMPPDRSRTFYDLEIGRTLLKGIYENNRFTPIERLEDKSNYKWYIHLQPEDYKTGKAYGEFWGEIPNYYKFKDGTSLYDYIERWISEGRDYGKKCNHNFFFRGNVSYQKLSTIGWCCRIKNIFFSETGVPVTPKELRKMYVTYLKEQRASEDVLEAASCGQKHSRLMQSSIYDQQDKISKMAPIMEFNRRKFEEYQNRA